MIFGKAQIEKKLKAIQSMVSATGFELKEGSSEEEFKSFLAERDKGIKGDAFSLTDLLAANNVSLEEGETAEEAFGKILDVAKLSDELSSELKVLKEQSNTLVSQLKAVAKAGIAFKEDASAEDVETAVKERISTAARERLSEHGINETDTPEGQADPDTTKPDAKNNNNLTGIARVEAALKEEL